MSADPLDSPVIPAALREALRFSPDNAPLLLHVAETALRNGGFVEAEAFFKRALALAPADPGARLGLATAFFQQGKHGPALVIIEDLAKHPPVPPRAHLLHARLALLAGEARLAAQHYAQALAADPSLADSSLAADLGPHLPRPAPAPASRPPAPSFSPAPPPPRATGEAGPSAREEDAEEATEDVFETDDPFGTGADDIDRERLPAGDLPQGDANAEVERPKLGFDDVGGMERVKDEIRMKIILPMRQPELFRAYGKSSGGGILLYGPPGCGKTYLARATAGEVQAGFIAVGINDVLEMWIGQSEKNLHAIFEQARSHRPCVLFFDEVDALGANRTDMLKTGGRQLINQFLSELDGVSSANDGVLVLAATNTPWHLDPAFRRPGRFDRILFVPPPDAPARASILRLHLRGKPVAEVDFDAVAKKTDGFSGADLRAVVDLAVEEKLRAAMRTGRVEPVGQRELIDAAKRHRPTVRDWFDTAKNYALYANQGGLYDDVLAHLGMKK